MKPSYIKATQILIWLILSGVINANASIFTVIDRSDDGSSITVGTLRWAVDQANNASGPPHTISFNLSNSITVLAPLIITRDLTTVTGRGNTIGALNTNIFQINGNYCTFQNLAIIRGNRGIYLVGSNNQIRACRIGIDWANGINLGNGTGIRVEGNNNLIGGANITDRNIISNHRSTPGTTYGIYIYNGLGTVIKNNFIGPDSTGENTIHDATYYGNTIGLRLDNAQQTLVGSDFYTSGNLISGNYTKQIEIINNSTGNTICGNIIGLSLSRTIDLESEQETGIDVNASPGNWIGLSTPNGFNIIAGNSTGGGYYEISIGSSNKTTIRNNYIGIDPLSGNTFLGVTGLRLLNCNDCLIGGNRASGFNEKNVITRQNWCLTVTGSGNSISGNYIGLNAAGNAAVPGTNNGLLINGNGNLIGGPNINPSSLLGNVVSGIAIGSSYTFSVQGTGNSIVGNYIGLSSDGLAQISNAGENLVLSSAANCLVGGNTSANANLICGTTTGMNISASGTTIVGNIIGILANGTTPPSPLNCGISLNNSGSRNTIGSKNGGPGNLIAGTLFGILVDGLGTTRNGIFGNTICSFSNPITGTGIFLSNNGNLNKPSPLIQTASMGLVSGQAQANDYVEVFKADRDTSTNGGSLRLLGFTTASAAGAWSLTVTAVADVDFVCATASDINNNTSSYSQNYVFIKPPTPTSTPTQTCTPTPTATPTAIPTILTPDDFQGHLIDSKHFFVYPNPVRGTNVKFKFFLKQAADIKIRIYTPQGRFVWEKTSECPMGWNELTWNALGMANGVYFYLGEARNSNYTEKVTKKLGLVK